jgi:tRNA threonylcarbamoyladenosine biosynthesis protein TsaB
MNTPLILHIETATPICSVSIARGSNLIVFKEAETTNSHARMLAPMILQLLAENNFSVKDLNAIAVSEGPGSYTGLRIGLSTAKGICYAANLPLILVNTLQAMAAGIKESVKDENVFFVPVLDARRNDVYWNIFDGSLNALSKTDCNNIEEIVQQIAEKNLNVVVAGTGAFKFEAYQSHLQILHENVIGSKHLMNLALSKLEKSDFADLAYSEPVYRT